MEKTEEITFDDHNHFFTGNVDGESVEKAIRWILMGARKPSPDHPMKLHINSEGGSLNDAFALIDVMRTSPVPIATVGMGNLMSSAFMIFTAGAKGRRAIARNTSIMIHQFASDYTGKYHDMRAYVEEIDSINKRMIVELSRTSGLTEEYVQTKLLNPSDVWLTAEQLVELGFADIIF
jgi:ATP-dependent Clp endopeptidase proteolytic subunit ClpP